MNVSAKWPILVQCRFRYISRTQKVYVHHIGTLCTFCKWSRWTRAADFNVRHWLIELSVNMSKMRKHVPTVFIYRDLFLPDSEFKKTRGAKFYNVLQRTRQSRVWPKQRFASAENQDPRTYEYLCKQAYAYKTNYMISLHRTQSKSIVAQPSDPRTAAPPRCCILQCTCGDADCAAQGVQKKEGRACPRRESWFASFLFNL